MVNSDVNKDLLKIDIDDIHKDQSINIGIDTINLNKQAIIFVNTKNSAEKTAEEISKKNIKLINKDNLMVLSNDILDSISKPTKQCKRLSLCVKKGIAFHHSGLTQKQKDLIQDNFLKGTIKIICATPTLAAGVDLPAFRSIIKDTKRYTKNGMDYIPVLEFMQMSGRAGRPNFDKIGQAIIICKNENEKEFLIDNYINGKPEKIYSKIAVEPALRFYLLSLISNNFVKNKKQIINFFSKTFWAYQYEDMNELEKIINKMLKLLKDYNFINSSSDGDFDNDFVDANEIEDENFYSTKIGKRISQLYIDPLTANNFILAMKNQKNKTINDFSFIQMICNSNEIRPLLRVKNKEYDFYNNFLMKNENSIITKISDSYSYDFDIFLDTVKTSCFFLDWVDEMNEDEILEKYNIRPGEINYKINICDWLLYSCIEIAKLLNITELLNKLNKLRIRIKYGVKEELLLLLRFKNIGRNRARKLFNNRIKDIKDIKTIDYSSLSSLIGPRIAKDLKEQVGEKINVVLKNKRKGQLSINNF
ncbi:MAG: helicase-related protein [Nanoarchaeota archaeon]